MTEIMQPAAARRSSRRTALRRVSLFICLFFLGLLATACGGLESGNRRAASGSDTTGGDRADGVAPADVGADSSNVPDISKADNADASEPEPHDASLDGNDASLDGSEASLDGNDTSLDAEPDLGNEDIELPPLDVTSLIPTPPADPLQGSGIVSCGIYQQERCEAGKRYRCNVYDTVSTSFVSDPDPLLHRVLLFERWYDLYHSPNSLRVERQFKSATPPGTPEADWASLEHFDRYLGEGDSALHSWPGMMAKMIRYSLSGTEADYQRLEKYVRDYLTLFSVTGIPGYLARAHGLYYDMTLQEGAPFTDRQILWYKDRDDLKNNVFTFDATNIPDLPDAYRDGLPDKDGKLQKGQPMWKGNPSIDSYTGATVSLPLVYPLLRDESLKAAIRYQLPCYLKRLRRIEMRNLQANPIVLEAVQKLLAGAGYEVRLDPDDIDLTTLDTIVAYYLPTYNKSNAGTYDKSCPETIQMTPTRVIDAAATGWQTKLVTLALDLQSAGKELQNGIDHIYIPSVRGGDAIHMIHLAALSYMLTGDEQYRQFLFGELIGKLHADKVALTTMALQIPDWCGTYYGDHITVSPLWALIGMLAPSPLRTTLQKVMETEVWQKRIYNQRHIKFNLLYSVSTPDELATGKSVALAQFLADLPLLAGNSLDPLVPDDPRRNYDSPRQYVIDHLPSDNALRCPSDSEREFCEKGFTVLGFQIPIEQISGPCEGYPGECSFGDGSCSRPVPKLGLPPQLRFYEGSWYGSSPFEFGRTYPSQGTVQSPGLELIEPFWIARLYGVLQNGKGQVLAWEPVGDCN